MTPGEKKRQKKAWKLAKLPDKPWSKLTKDQQKRYYKEIYKLW